MEKFIDEIQNTLEYKCIEEIWSWTQVPIRDEVKKSRMLEIIYNFGISNWNDGFNTCHEVHKYE